MRSEYLNNTSGILTVHFNFNLYESQVINTPSN
jgi:hypothetical protein